jgi:hypothetical protein
MGKKWEFSHAITMLPGFLMLFRSKDLGYHCHYNKNEYRGPAMYCAFCATSCIYHLTKAITNEQGYQNKNNNKKIIISPGSFHIIISLSHKHLFVFIPKFLQRADFFIQLVACYWYARVVLARYVISALMCASFFLDLNDQRQKRVHLVMNGAGIVLSNLGNGAASMALWSSVVACAVAFNVTRWDAFHSLMHLCGHAAFYSTYL